MSAKGDSFKWNILIINCINKSYITKNIVLAGLSAWYVVGQRTGTVVTAGAHFFFYRSRINMFYYWMTCTYTLIWFGWTKQTIRVCFLKSRELGSVSCSFLSVSSSCLHHHNKGGKWEAYMRVFGCMFAVPCVFLFHTKTVSTRWFLCFIMCETCRFLTVGWEVGLADDYLSPQPPAHFVLGDLIRMQQLLTFYLIQVTLIQRVESRTTKDNLWLLRRCVIVRIDLFQTGLMVQLVPLCHFRVTFTRITFMSPFSLHHGLRAAKKQMKNKICKTVINGSESCNHEI